MNVPDERLTFMEAATRLSISKNAARMRVQRGSLASVRVDGVTYVLWPPRPAVPAARAGTNDERVHARASERAEDGTNEPLVAALNERIASLERQLDAEREGRRRADTIILELSRHVVALPAGEDAAQTQNKGAGATKTVDVREDAAPPATSSWSRFWRALTGR